MKRTHVFLPEPMLDALKKISEEHDVSVSELLRFAVARYLSRQKAPLIGLTTVGSWEDEAGSDIPVGDFSAIPLQSFDPPPKGDVAAGPAEFIRQWLPGLERAMAVGAAKPRKRRKTQDAG